MYKDIKESVRLIALTERKPTMHDLGQNKKKTHTNYLTLQKNSQKRNDIFWFRKSHFMDDTQFSQHSILSGETQMGDAEVNPNLSESLVLVNGERSSI